MKELSLNILDIAENSLKAKATLTEILLFEDEETLIITIRDNGTGMKKEMCERVIDPFCTSRTTRKVGLGIPFFKLSAEQTGGSFRIESRFYEDFPENHGTVVEAKYNKNHIDFTPLGDVTETLVTLIQGHPDTDIYFCHTKNGNSVELDTRALRAELGDEISLSEIEILCWIREYLNEQYINL